jgi:hypothetical protein
MPKKRSEKRPPKTSLKRGCGRVKPTQKQLKQLSDQGRRAEAFLSFNRKRADLPGSTRLKYITEVSQNLECYPSHTNYLWSDIINEGKEALNDYKETTKEYIMKENKVLKERTDQFKWVFGPHWLSDTDQGKYRN